MKEGNRMILSRFSLDLHQYAACKLIQDYQLFHRAVMQLFGTKRSDNNVLFRYNSKTANLYILSKCKPNLQFLPKCFTLLAQRDMTSWEENIENGQYYRFDILVNPIKTSENKRFFLREEKDRRAWLSRKAEQSGFNLEQVREGVPNTIKGVHTKDKGASFSFQSVGYQGILRVTDKEKFRSAWENGIGKEKAYGQGLLMLLPC